ncbi:MAG: hypothetical protein KJO38_10030, partial [Gammaproteobacteria bacterium]|nr:hypothetical protein [Gammaproteobacteria bacterium]
PWYRTPLGTLGPQTLCSGNTKRRIHESVCSTAAAGIENAIAPSRAASQAARPLIPRQHAALTSLLVNCDGRILMLISPRCFDAMLYTLPACEQPATRSGNQHHPIQLIQDPGIQMGSAPPNTIDVDQVGDIQP